MSDPGYFMHILKQYTGKDVIALDREEVISGQLFAHGPGRYGIGNPQSPTWEFFARDIENITQVVQFDTVVIRI